MKIYIVILTLLTSTNCFCQIKVHDINTDEDVIKFVSEYGQKYNMEWGKISFDNMRGMFSQNERKKSELIFLDSLTKSKWIKSDFNKDSKTDLVFSGRLNSQLAVLAFISDGDSIVHSYLGSNLNMYYPSSINKLKAGDLNLLIVSHFLRDGMQYEITNSYKTDTLIYKFGGFVELNMNVEMSADFDSLIFRTFSPWMGFVEIPKIKIRSNGSVTLYRNPRINSRDSVFWNDGINETAVSSEMISELKLILGYINFWQLNPEFEIKYVSDLSTAVTEVYYEGRVKKVRDYGWHGTYGLSLLYKKINEIKFMSLPKLH